MKGRWAPWEALSLDHPAAHQCGARLLPVAWPQVWGRPACWGQTQPPVPPGAVGDRSPAFLPLCPSLLMWHHEQRRARRYSAPQSCAHSVLGEELAPRPGTCSTPSPARTVTPASPRDVHSMLLLARVLDTFVPSTPENQPYSRVTGAHLPDSQCQPAPSALRQPWRWRQEPTGGRGVGTASPPL